MFDKDDSGSINLEELKEVFGASKIRDEDWKEIIKEVDENGDGEVLKKIQLLFVLYNFVDLVYRIRQDDE